MRLVTIISSVRDRVRDAASDLIDILALDQILDRLFAGLHLQH